VNAAPLSVRTPTGETLAPIRVLVVDDVLTIEDKAGNVLATDTVTGVTEGSRITTVDGASGRWVARRLCACSSSQKAALRDWYG
jgi:hypothetical protein